MLGLLAALLYWAAPSATQDSLQVGYSILTPDPNSPAPVAIALFRLANDQGTLISEAGVEAVRPLRAGRIFVDQSDALTGLALANLGAEEAAVQFVLRRIDGSEEARRSLIFNAGQHRAVFVNPDLFPQIAHDFSGTLTFSASDPEAQLAAVTIRQAFNSLGEPLFATLPVVRLDSGEPEPETANGMVVFPHVGAGQGLSTQIVLINRSGQAATGMIRLRRSDGEPLEARFNGADGSEFPFQLAPDGAFRASITSSGEIAQGFASVEAVAGPVPAGTAIFQFRDEEDGLVSEAGVAAAEDTRRFRLFVDAVGTQTGVAFANPRQAEALLEVELRDRNGFLLRSAQAVVPPEGHMAQFAEQFFGALPANFTGLMEVRSQTPVVPISLKLTFNSRGDAILTTLPVADLTLPLSSQLLAFPQIGFGGADRLRFSTRFILLNPSLEEDSSGTLRFLRSDGGLLEVTLAGRIGSEFPIRLEAGSARRLRPGNSAGPARIVIDTQGLSEIAVNVGNSVALSATVFDDQGEVRDDLDVSFASLDSEVAAVDRFGRVTGNQPGFSTLSAASGGALANVTVAVVAIASAGGSFEITGLARDLSRRFYLADTLNHAILRAEDLEFLPDLYAGVSGSFGLRDDRRFEALFRGPAFLAINQATGSLYVSDSLNHAIRVVEAGPDGCVVTLTGGIEAGHRDGPLDEARFNQPHGVALDQEGNLWVADRGNHAIRRISLSAGTVETIAGLPGQPGFRDGPGEEARFNSPVGLAVEAEPLAEHLDRVLRGEGPPPVRVVVADLGNGALRRVDEEGRATTLSPLEAEGTLGIAGAAFSTPFGVAVDGGGNIYVSDRDADRVRILLRGGGLAEAAESNTFSNPRGIVLADAGRIVVADGSRFGTEARFGSPEIFQVSPGQVSSRGGQELTIRGRNFAPETVVVVANRVLDEDAVSIQDTQTLLATLPPLSSGLTTLTVQTRGGLAQSALLVEPIPLSELAPASITTVAGGSTFSGDGGSALKAPAAPVGIALDQQGRVLFLDSSRNSLRQIDPDTGVVTSVAGNGVPDSQGDGNLAAAASLFPIFPGSSNFVVGAAVDPSGNIFLSDGGRIRKIDASTGVISTAAGGEFGFCGDGEPASQACFDNPNGLAFDAQGNLYVADTGNYRVRRIDAETGLISTVAGDGRDEFSGDGGPAVDASLDSPVAVALDSSGNLYISTRNRIRNVDSQGDISNFAGTGELSGGDIGDGGPAVEAEIGPLGLAVDPTGAVLVADRGNQRIRRIDLSGVITTVAGTGESGYSGDGGPASSAQLSNPNDLVVDGAGNIVFCDLSNFRVRRIEARSGLISRVAGNGEPRFDDEGEPLASSSLLFPRGLAFDDQGNLYISDSANSRIRRAGADGRIRTIAGNDPFAFSGDGGPAIEADLSAPRGLAFDRAGNLLLADTSNNRIRRIDLEGIISTLVGANQPAFVPGFGGDGGPASEALLARPRDVAVDGAGNLYIADTQNDRVRRVDGVTGIIETLVGEGGIHPEPLLHPGATEITSSGALLIADSVNRRILRLESDRLTVAAGGPAQSFCDQDDRADEVSLSFPQGLAADGDGGFYIADTINHRILKVDADGAVRTVAGTCDPHFGGDGGPAVAAGLDTPSALALDAQGNLYIADTDNHRVRVVRAASP